MKNGGEAEMTDTVVGSCLDCIRASEANEIEVLIKGSRIGGEKPQSDIELISSGSQDVALSEIANGKDFGPVTPILVEESMDLSSSPDLNEDEDLALGCQTPTENIFDPFAPGPEGLAVAPKKKIMRVTQNPLRRQLNFEFCCDSDEEEDRMLDSIHKSFHTLILTSQFRELSCEIWIAESNPSEGPKTPTCLHLLTGIEESCPDAPMRPTSSKSRRLGDKICPRKIDFGGN